jgi:hypothetical protein
MAYKRSNGKLQRRKMEPAVKTLYFTTPTATTEAPTDSYIDLSQVASLVNRRFYRQGINWVVSGFKITSSVPGAIMVNKLPETWIMHNAWKKGFAVWNRMNQKALEESESVKPRFLDFKIYADSQHHTLGFGANLLPNTLDNGGVTVATPGEWESSKLVMPQATGATAISYELIATGVNNPGAGASGLNAKSLIEGYASSRALPAVVDPNVPDDASDLAENWMQNLFNEGTQQDAFVMDDMVSENNIAPYPFEDDGTNVDTMYPGGANQLGGLQLHDFATITATTVGGITYLKGGEFPCGLIKISHAVSSTAGNIGIQIDLVPGTHRGYMCESMGA